MGELTIQFGEQNGAAQHLHAALEATDTDKKHFHIRQALQHLGIQATTA